MLKELIDIKKLGVNGVKLEYESEFYDEVSAYEFAELVHRVGLNLCVKLGGFSSVQDLHMCKKICANSIVAPMIESAYAVEKFLHCVNQVYRKAYPELLLNIESKVAFEHLEEILSICDNKISGFVIGRSDLMRSLDIENPDDEKILEYCIKLSERCKETGKKLIIGGKINGTSIDFISKIPYLSAVETRKVIFDISFLNEKNIEEFLNFELKTLKFKKNLYKEDIERIKFIENSLNPKELVVN